MAARGTKHTAADEEGVIERFMCKSLHAAAFTP
eukprot:SAG31_NODE_45488_length_258_cov_1.289308_1_plen_32_part_10